MLSILVPRQADQGRRDMLWSWCQRRYQAVPGAEVVVGTNAETPFCLPAAINEAAAEAAGDVFFIGSADVAVDFAWLATAVEMVEKEPMQSVRCSRIHLLSQPLTDSLLAKDPTGELDEEGNPVVAGSVGCIVFSKALFDAVGGMDERFKGWGPEDAAFHMALTTIGYPSHILDGDLRHLWHQPAPGRWGENHRTLLTEYEQAWGNRPAMVELLQRIGGS